MIEDKQPAFSDETIRRFLLGSLNSTDQSSFEHSLFVDGHLEERVRLAELELSDDYAANRLSHADRELFQQRFLVTTNRQRTLAVSRALQHNFAVADSIARVGFWQKAVSIFDVRHHGLKYAFATLTLILLLLATALLVKKDQSRLVFFPFKPPKAGPRPGATSTPRMTNHSTNAPAPAHNETSPVLPSHEGLTASVVLDAETPLGSAPTISASGDTVIVQLKLAEPLAGAYGAKVITMAGESVFSASSLQRAEENSLAFDLPMSAIKPGDFQIVLTRVDDDSNQSAAIYFFRVR